jgi:hypothetical protein
VEKMDPSICFVCVVYIVIQALDADNRGQDASPLSC